MVFCCETKVVHRGFKTPFAPRCFQAILEVFFLEHVSRPKIDQNLAHIHHMLGLFSVISGIGSGGRNIFSLFSTIFDIIASPTSKFSKKLFIKNFVLSVSFIYENLRQANFFLRLFIFGKLYFAFPRSGFIYNHRVFLNSNLPKPYLSYQTHRVGGVYRVILGISDFCPKQAGGCLV